ncbi:acylase [Aestuariibacter salexigens]|uniref:acylase n=1 Tax=Aestuariibacter salexigens TaxID=226010 RepID=UPI000402B292|nr:acylase [Aestuariibacter salexigens]
MTRRGKYHYKQAIKLTITALSAAVLIACGGDDNEKLTQVEPPSLTPAPTPTPTPAPPVTAFDPDGVLEASIRYTDYGVPHIKADNLESMAYGVGYAFASDNICILADQIVRYNSKRSAYFGPDAVPGSGDSSHLINDFGFLALQIREQAEQGLPTLSANTRAMLQGYTQGYNRYLSDTGVANIDPACANMPWVQPIDSVDLLTYALGVALLPGAANFLGPIFLAAPDGVNFAPQPAQANVELPFSVKPKVDLPEMNENDLGSNGWGLGSDMTENGRGIVLGNPHFPHTGNLRFWQFHTTIPGHLNVMGGSLTGLPGAVNIGFNENVAWTHTFSTAEHFVVYQLALDGGDPRQLTHNVDGDPRTIYPIEHEIDVAVGPGQTIKLSKTTWHTNYGPMIEVPGSFDWGPGGNAFAIKDANAPNFDIMDHWLGMNLASSMDEFKEVFKRYDGVIFNNTMAASADGQVFYIDDSTVPDLTPVAINALTTNPVLIQTKQLAGFTVLPGFISQFDFTGPVPYENAPKYEGNDYVQNSNDSFWLTNLDSPITGVNPLYGQVGNQQSLRSRMAHTLLQDSAGSDGKFSPAEVEQALLSNRSYLSESVLDELLSICSARGTDPVMVNDTPVDISPACAALSLWDGTMNKDSVAAHLFREFAFQFRLSPQWTVPFDVNEPVTTPRGLANNDTTLAQLATAMLNVQAAGVALDATLGEVQFVERSLPNGAATGVKLPWGGAHNVEGGFNVFDTATGNNGTLLPRHVYAPLNNTTRLSAEGQGYHINYGSSWMMVVGFTDAGPQARGLLSYSQSSRFGEDDFDDQTLLYSSQPQLRNLRFTESDIADNLVMQIDLSSNQ